MPGNVSLALIKKDNTFVLQLRDFKSWINDPGCWGLFGGHLENKEDPLSGLKRELNEELGWSPYDANYEYHFYAYGFNIYVFSCILEPGIIITLNEGQEIGEFRFSEILSGHLMSRRWKKKFPLTPISRDIFNRINIRDS